VKEKIKIVLVDDHRIFRKGLKSLLSESANIEVLAEAVALILLLWI
jgi:DNA-binding NarL/FixJ family response regulator